MFGGFHIKLTICTLTFLATSCGRAPVNFDTKNVFGEDNREELSVDSSPGKAVGRLDLGCSGAMVGKKLVLTAAHCVYDPTTDALKTNLKFFKVGYKNGEFLQESWVNAAWIGTRTPVEDRKNDWAILQLSDSIGDQSGWFGVRGLDIADNLPLTVNLAGYASDKSQGEIAQVAKNCYIHKVDESGRLLHDCDAATGTSGGPMYVMDGADPYIVGITAAEFRSGNRSMNRDHYTNEYANIGVSGQGFLNTVSQLRSSVDSGREAPTISESFFYVNLNANNGASDDDDQNNDDQDNDDQLPGGDDDATNRAAWEAHLVSYGQVIAAEAEALTINANAIRNYAISSGLYDLASAAGYVAEYADYTKTYALRMAHQTVDRSAGANDLLLSISNIGLLIDRLNQQYGRFYVGSLVNVQLGPLMVSVSNSRGLINGYVQVR